ncbi:CRISPR-associated protein, APE2256 family [Desulfonatronospira thiodismutans ASO3-1]|uniref:CRISPR-associated protein, APE2256 family n=1 Tax=Desulfonatronospira thiodismutans ASO3-1 TaxID=555779 RepID=D6SPU8_9BACT|nr:putative CRISPR-associated protein [Desulfonatronospira thiodismutans]EFI34774.1 CRISPR-associated protein, APE2256 family [Desulfonatronospira thiodismutans ASO3-1]
MYEQSGGPNLICTVGTSLLYSSLKPLDPETAFQLSREQVQPQHAADYDIMDKAGWLQKPQDLKDRLFQIKEALGRQEFTRLGKLLASFPAELRMLGAEINSIEAMVRKGFLGDNRVRLVLLVSDTPDGEAMGSVLQSYFTHPDCHVAFEQCYVEKVQGLQDEKPLDFQTEGLTNLVRLLGEHFRKWGGAIAINATGGYKAQIALAVAFGQAAGATVYYKHERFDQVIKFPRIPLSLDMSLVQNNLKVWADLAEPGCVLDEKDLKDLLGDDANLLQSMASLLDRVQDDGATLFSLSALGMVYWEAFRSAHPEVCLEPAKVDKRRGCRFRDDHYPVGFKEYVHKFYDSFPEHVSECHSVPYDRQSAIKNRFYDLKSGIIGEYSDRNGFGARFQVLTLAANELERSWLVKRFQEWLEEQ